MINTAQLLHNTYGISAAAPASVETSIVSVSPAVFASAHPDCLQILSQGGKEFSRATTELAISMMEHHEALRGFLAELRRAASTQSLDFRFEMSALTAQHQEQVLEHANRMVGILSNVYHHRAANFLSGKIAEVPACVEFVKGGYLEVAAESITRREVERFCQSRGLQGQVSRNVVVTDGQVKNELDILIDIQGIRMFIEVKSGSCPDFQKYYRIGRRYGLIPDRILLVGAQLSDDLCMQLHDFLEYYTSNLDSFAQTLNNMLEKNFGGNA